MLNRKDYLEAVKLTQIVSVDLIIKDKNGKILLGKRKNQPAKDTYFVPGGRVFKGETLTEGFKRLLKVETGITDLTKVRWSFNCVTDHLYHNNFAEAVDEKGEDIPMHFVCTAINVFIDSSSELNEEIFKVQHQDSIWLMPSEIVGNDLVHKYTQRYFMESVLKLS